MKRSEIIQICNSQVLEKAAARFGTHKGKLKMFPEYEDAANLVYEYELDKEPLILRISFTPERTLEQIQAELHFINYLSQNGAKVSTPVPSQAGNLVETVQVEGIPFHIVTFVKGKGMRMPDNGYRYRAGAPIEEYFRNWGRTLGKMHVLTKNYQPVNDLIKRPDWFDLHKNRLALVNNLPERLHRVQLGIQLIFDEVKSLPRNTDYFGLIHGDFNDGNFTVDYENGDITVYDFDDCCHFWFMYEIASTWVSGTGWTMHRALEERRSFMEHYMGQVMAGYNQENLLPGEWLKLLPLFIKLVHVEDFLHYSQYLNDLDDELQGELNYKIKCIENKIPYMGFFDDIYSPKKPFSL
jgi:Ser/Thr protein kinase RdoA (MazF antagonist)